MSKSVYTKVGYGMRPKTLKISPFIIYVIITFLVYVLPAMKVTIPYVISGTLMLVFLPVAMLKKKRWLNYAVLLLTLSSWVFFLDILSGGYSLIECINEVIRNVRFFLPVLWTAYAMEYCDVSLYKQFMVCFIATVGMILFKTINALEQNQWITRILAQAKTVDTPEIRAYRLQNVGGFEFSYMMGIVTLCLVWTAIKAKNKVIRNLSICAAVISFYYIIQTMYTTLLLLTSIGVLLLVVFSIKNQLIRVVLSILLCMLPFGMAPFFEFLSGVFTDSLLSTKFMQMHNALTGGGAEALGSRPGYILDALRNWSHSPLIGGYNVGNKAHSVIFATLEKNGLIGLFAFGFMFYKSWRLLVIHMKVIEIDKLLINIVFLYVLALAFLNPVGYVFEVTIAAFFVTPLWSVLVKNMEGKS